MQRSTGGRSVVANVEEAMEESESLVGLEPTWEEMKDQLLVALDALSVAILTFTAQVTALDLDNLSRKSQRTLMNIRT